MTAQDRTGENRCWPCTVANAVVGLLVAMVPLVAALAKGDPNLVAGTAVWAVAILGATIYLLLKRGYLPFAEPVAKRTGLHDRIGPGADPKPPEKEGE